MRNLGVPLPLDMVECYGTPPRNEPTAELLPALSACEEIDGQLGTHMLTIMEWYCKIDPRMKELRIQIDRNRKTETEYGPDGFDGPVGCYVNLNPTKEHYQDPIDLGYLAVRFASRKGRLSSLRTGNFDFRRVADFVAAHEIGHQKAFLDMVRLYGGNTALTNEARLEQRLWEMGTLPLGTGTAIALEYWKDKKSGFRKRLTEHYGPIRARDWARLLRLNGIAYPQTASESAADWLADTVLLRAGLIRA